MHVRGAHDDWRLIDRRIQGLAAQQGQLDLELGQWLLAAKRVRVHNHLGFGSFSEYVTRRLGYNAKSALDRLRVAEALERLPKLRGMLRRGERSWSALREITRRATPETEDAWIARTEGKTVREIERMASLQPGGQGPEATYRVVVELSAADYADFLAAAEHARTEIGPAASQQEVVMAMVHRELGRRGESEPGYQTAVTLCAGCERTWRQEAGQSIEVADAVGACARCDAEVVGATVVEPTAHGGRDEAEPLDDPTEHVHRLEVLRPATTSGAAGPEPTAHVGRAEATLRHHVRRHGAPGLLDLVAEIFAGPMRTLTPALRKAVRARDGGRCVVPGCTHFRFVDIHHLVPVAMGGPHALANLVSLCTAHHQRLHEGVLAVEPDGSLGWAVRQGDGARYGHAG
ncbi:MAG: HNH endonuclease signature motif containing protein [Myxococcota bacterium]